MRVLPVLALVAGVGGCAEHASEPAPVPVAKADSCKGGEGAVSAFLWGALGAGIGTAVALLIGNATD